MLGKQEMEQGQDSYYLLNKNQIIARFHVEATLQAIVIDEQMVELPEWRLTALENLIHRNIKQILGE